MIDLMRLAWSALHTHRLRSALSMLGIAIGVTSVVLLASIGEGTRRYILDQFTQFGTNIVAVNPGKAETAGIPGVLGGTTHPLTLDDAIALERLPEVESAVPMALGSARVEGNARGRSVFVYGVGAAVPEVWKFQVKQGAFWPETDVRRGSASAVLGPTLKRELFGDAPAIGRFVRIAGSRFRIVGIMESKGRMLGFDIDDSAYIPVASAMRIFNLEELTEIDMAFRTQYQAEEVVEAVRAAIIERHGRDDVTVNSQEAMLEVFDNVMGVVSMAVGGIASVSLLVGSVGILTMMWIAVGERIGEIGLLRSIGATRRQVLALFLGEAAALSTVGGLIGLGAAVGLVRSAQLLLPGLPVSTPVWLVGLALGVSLATGVISGALPAMRAARLDPIEALRAE